MLRIGERFITDLTNIPSDVNSILSSRRVPVDTPKNPYKKLALGEAVGINLNV